uniref:protein FAM83G isoform X2 n=1 Tax=Gasterosteus aculeatus aculeatus TaxID=481459 RepID=UPI001A99419E|nr:protein FAM83G isoform X2 [Gasterosteus aculeatus aculeatus]
MALSQVQCLDDNHVNARTHESKAEFLYCEDQRLALEAFLRDGRDALAEFLSAQGLRGFLSDPELETLAEAAEPYDPGSELFFPENGERPLSLQYWPELSDTSVPQMDLSWPDNVSYRGVTRTTVYTQPPLEGQVHIKEVVRKMIAQAQKVIAVVMDVFTDVDIFRDLLDAGFRRKVSVYILLERKTLPHFQSMCQRANMHAGHLKNLRVRCTDGAEFHSRSCTKVRGRMGHRFMFIDGDKAVSGSYSFTWMSSRLDKNLITVVTGQAVEAFDKLFCVLYATSTSVDLRLFATGNQPKLEPLPQPVPVAATSADIARKLYSPKYALAALGNPAPSSGPQDTQNLDSSKNPETKKGGRKRASKEAIDPPIHPGLTNLEKVCMMSYLPTWPEPDPPSDVIGFINIRDTSKPNQGHLQRSEMFETSQAIRFSSPFSAPEETLPQVATPRPAAVRHQQSSEREEAKTTESGAGTAPPAPPKEVLPDDRSQAGATGPKSESDTVEARSNLPDDRDTSTARPPDTGGPASGTRPLRAGSNPNVQREVSQEAHPQPPANSHGQTKKPPPCTDLPAQAVAEPPHVSCEPTPNVDVSVAPPSTSVSASSSLSQNSHASEVTDASSASIRSSLTCTTPDPLLPSRSSASLASTPPVPKPRTVKLVIDGRGLPEIRSSGLHVVRRPPDSLRSGRGVDGAEPEEAEPAPNVGETLRPTQTVTSQGAEAEEAEGRSKKAAVRPLAENEAGSCVLVSEAQSVNIHGIIPTDSEPETAADSELTPQIERVAPVWTETKARRGSEVPNEQSESFSERKTYLARAQVPQRISYGESTLRDVDVLQIVEEQDLEANASTHAPGRPRHLRLCGPGLDGVTQLPSARHRTPTPDGFSPRTPNPDDFQTPTSDGYASEEFYECVFTHPVRNRGAAIGDSEGSSGPGSISSLSSLKDKTREEKVTNGRGEDESVGRTGGGYRGTERRGSEDPKRTSDHFKQDKNPTRSEEENKEARAMRTKRGRNQSAAEKPVDGGEITNERLSIGDLHQKKPSSERKRTDGEALGPSGAERKDRPPDVQKRSVTKLKQTVTSLLNEETGPELMPHIFNEATRALTPMQY